jgi:peptide/nickel transport system permease protein
LSRYLVRRLITAVPLLLGVTILVYGIMHAMPGDPMDFLIDPTMDPASFQALKEELGLNKPLYVQYWQWLKKVVQGDFGWSIRYRRPVTDMLGERVGPTLLLTGSAYLIALLVAVPLGILTATRQYSLFDYSVSGLAFMGLSLPSFFTALLAIYFFAVKLQWVPTGGMMTPGNPLGFFENLSDRMYHLLLPCLTLAVRDMTGLTRFSRSSMLEVMRQDYVRTARSKGLPERVVIFKHAFRNGSLPLITLFGLNLPDLFSGVIIFETIFVWPGVGQMAFEAVLNRDYPIIITINLIAATLVITGNLLADLLYAVADPRIRYT